MKPISLLLTAFTGLTLTCHAAVRVAWTARYTVSDAGTNQAFALALDKDGSIIVSGHGTSTTGDSDYVTIKYSTDGTRLWASRYASPTNDQVRSMAVDKDGNTYITGTSVTVKYGADGSEQWTAPYAARGLALDPHGDVYVTGFSSATYATAKVHKDAGTNLWSRTYTYLGRPGFPDISQVITVDSKSNVFVGGRVYCRVGHPSATYLNRLVIGYDGEGNDVFVSIPIPDGCFNSFVRMVGIGTDYTGAVYEVSDVSSDGVEIIKFTSTGSRQWEAYGSYVLNGLRASVVDSNGFVYLTGRGADIDAGMILIETEKISPSGTNVWSVNYRGPGVRSGNAITLDGFGSVYVTGQTPGPGTSEDYITIKYDPSGNEKWVQRYDGPAHGDDVATAIAVAPDGSVYVTGWSTTSSNLIEITTIKYVQSPSLTLDPNRNAQLQFLGAPGASNRVQATTDFLDWLDLGFSIADTNGCLRFLDTNAPGYPYRFYRMVPP